MDRKAAPLAERRASLLISTGAFVLCFALLEVFSAIHSKRRAKLDDTEEDADG